MSQCCVTGCESDRLRECDRMLSFHDFPTDETLKNKWLQKIRRDNDPGFQIRSNTKVCSKHFTKKCFRWDENSQRTCLTEGSVPGLFPHAKILCIELPVSESRRNAEEGGRHSPHVDHNYCQPLRLETAQQEITHHAQEKSRICPQHFKNDPKLLHLYTGFQDYDTLRSVFLSLEPTADCLLKWSQDRAVQETPWMDPRVEMPLFDQFFLFVCCVRQGAFEETLANLFHVSVSTVRRVIITWANYLFFMLGSLPVWLHRSAVNVRMPRYFKESYPRTRVILDCMEIRIERTSSKVLNPKNSSDYKDSTTLQGLVGFSPSGEITFVSRLFEGSVSRKEMTKQSGILSLLEEGDEVIADESFLISDLLSAINVSLNVLIYDDVHRFHLQRFKGRTRQYRIFDSVLPLSLLGAVNQLWYACVMLSNFQRSFF
ncbi:uncharacterized protein LOC141791682 [Halichoeres trimaculatus]|uniref:uncharacterized protein LOC141791682 n=1 Tax=Halichoeres trimaculatus TaxID=147232 RepID=UPI003D9DC71F